MERKPRLREIAVDDALLLAIVPQSHGTELASWARKHEFQIGTSRGAEVPPDELAHLGLKIEAEAKQLPPGDANLVVISAQNLFITAEDPARLIEPVTALIGSEVMTPTISLIWKRAPQNSTSTGPAPPATISPCSNATPRHRRKARTLMRSRTRR